MAALSAIALSTATAAGMPSSKGERILIDHVVKRYDKTNVIPSLSVELAAGEFTVILGPSGCGKSTLLQMIAGLERVSDGRILFGSDEVQTLEPRKRGCAMVFQNYALYPHMSVRDNICYSLKIAGVSKAERETRVQAVATMLGLSDHLSKRPGQLSGGQRQRVAIGRAIIREPRVLLFDEPLSNLDAQLRHEMRIELAQLHRRIGATTVFVTHDQVEALTLADRILVLNKGQIEQFGTPKEIYRHPASVFVARFIGSPPMNLIPVTGKDGIFALQDGPVLGRAQDASTPDALGEFLLGIRPEDMKVLPLDGPAPFPAGDAVLTLPILYQEDLGSHHIIGATLPTGDALQIATPVGTPFEGDDQIRVLLPHQKLHLFSKESGKAVSGVLRDAPDA